MFKLAKASPAYIAEVAKTSVDTAHAWIETARLATLRGIGSANVKALREVGIHTVDALAAANWRVLDERLEDHTGRSIVDARVRVWIRGARRATASS